MKQDDIPPMELEGPVIALGLLFATLLVGLVVVLVA